MSRVIPSVLLAATFFACASVPAKKAPIPPTEGNTKMAVQALDTNKKTVISLYEEYFNQGKSDVVRAIVSDDYVGVDGARGAGGARGPQALASIAEALHTAFPDIHYTIEDVLAEGDRVCVRWKWEGTHTGPFRDYAITHKRFLNTGMAIFRLHDGKIVASSIETDRLGFLDQVGVIPAGLATAGPPRKAQ